MNIEQPMATAQRRGLSVGGLPDRVAQLYYSHGLFCSSHPKCVVVLAVTVVLICCYPLVNLPLPGNVPQQFTTLEANYSLPGNGTKPTSGTTSGDTDPGDPPPWYSASPLCYIQQVVIKSAVVPWSEDLILTDAFRAPLDQVFQLLEIIQNHELEQTGKTLANLCLHVESVKMKLGGTKSVLPEYNCLLLSPANLWQQNQANFQEDSNLLGTIFNYQNIQKGKISLAEILFGMNLKDSGIKRYPLRSRQRILHYSITIVFQQYHPQFIESLRSTLSTHYPLHTNHSEVSSQREIWHIYYPGEFNLKELVPLLITYFALFLYVYFSVRKMELVKSKVGIAFSAVVTTAASLAMAVGLCFFFGLRLTLDGREVFPYVVVAVGLENVLVLTKSVVSTPAHLDVKIRVAQGLSREGWSITKNLLTEVTILTIGFFTFVPAIQEFCIFAVVGLLSDFFLQMFFYSTVLAIDIHRTELSEPAMRAPRRPPSSSPPPRLSRSKSHPRLMTTASVYPTNVVAFPYPASQLSQPPAVPKRLRLMHFWARTRIFQRAFMLSMVVWIGVIAYNAGLVQKLAEVASENNTSTTAFPTEHKQSVVQIKTQNLQYINVTQETAGTLSRTLVVEKKSSVTPSNSEVEEEELAKLRHTGYEPWRMLSQHHWSAILGLYNVSSAGHYLSILPPITLSLPVSPHQAKSLRNVNEKGIPVQSQWQAIVAALDPLDFSDGDIKSQPISVGTTRSGSEVPFVPQSPMELFLTAVLCAISVLVLAYFMVVLYRCVCTRNYAEWRASWENENNASCGDSITQVVLETMPVVLEGHPQQVECLATDGAVVVSSCLAGEVRVWNVFSGENVATIDRKRFFGLSVRVSSEQDLDDLPLSDYESGSPPSRGEASSSSSTMHHYEQEGMHNPRIPVFRGSVSRVSSNNVPPQRIQQQRSPLLRQCDNAVAYYKKTDDIKWKMPDFRPTINTNFTGLKLTRSLSNENRPYDFSRYQTDFYEEDSEEDCAGGAGGGGEGEAGVVDPPSTPEGLCEQGRYAAAAVDPPPVWCMDCQDNLVVLGCSTGRLEFWEASTGCFKCLFEDQSGIGVTALKIIGNRVVVAKLSGSIDFYELESHRKGKPVEWSFTSFRRTHIRTGSVGSLDWESVSGVTEELRCLKITSIRAHQQPITVLDSEGGRILSGSQDHTLKVFRLEDQLPLYTLHGHCGPITALFIDKISPMMSGSGSQDGMLCVWDLLTGACMYSLQAHDGSVVALSYSASYVLSLGVDERLCVWERFQGHLLNTIHMSQSYCCNMVMLTHNLLITSKQDSLLVWDVRRGEPVRAVRLGHASSGVFVQHLIAVHNSVVCDYGSQLRVVRFPLVTENNTSFTD